MMKNILNFFKPKQWKLHHKVKTTEQSNIYLTKCHNSWGDTLYFYEGKLRGHLPGIRAGDLVKTPSNRTGIDLIFKVLFIGYSSSVRDMIKEVSLLQIAYIEDRKVKCTIPDVELTKLEQEMCLEEVTTYGKRRFIL